MTRVLLSTTSYQDTPGAHHELIESQGWDVVLERGPLSEEQMLELAGEFDGFICGDDVISREVIDKSLPRLKWISKYGIGVDKIDVDYATSKDIPVAFTPGVNHTTVAEHVFGLMISLAKKIPAHVGHTKNGEWVRQTGNEIAGKCLGVFGLGRIGKEVVKRANVFGMKSIAMDQYWDDAFAKAHKLKRAESVGDLFGAADVIVLCCSLNEETRDLVNRQTLDLMKPGAWLINCARGEIVNVEDVYEALESEKLGGYAADVLDQEPPAASHPLLNAKNTIVTPHIGSRTYESVVRQATKATENAIRLANGDPPLAQVNVTSISKGKPSNGDVYFVVDVERHNRLVEAAYLHRGYEASEAKSAARFCEMASTYGIRTHNAIKALHLDHLFGSKTGGCVPGAQIETVENRFDASEVWNANLKLGQPVAFEAMDRCIELADKYGIGQVSVDDAFHYLWGGGYVMDAALKGYIAYTNCTSTLAEVVPYGGKFPTLGTNPHSWAFPTQKRDRFSFGDRLGNFNGRYGEGAAVQTRRETASA